MFCLQNACLFSSVLPKNFYTCGMLHRRSTALLSSKAEIK